MRTIEDQVLELLGSPGRRVLVVGTANHGLEDSVAWAPLRLTGDYSILRGMTGGAQPVAKLFGTIPPSGVDLVLVDTRRSRSGFSVSEVTCAAGLHPKLFRANFTELTRNALGSLVSSIGIEHQIRSALIVGGGQLAISTASLLLDQGVSTTLWTSRSDVVELLAAHAESRSNFRAGKWDLSVIASLEELDQGSLDLLIASSDKQGSISSDLLPYLHPTTVLVDAGVGQFSPSLIEILRAEGRHVFRLGVDSGLLGWLVSLDYEIQNRSFDGSWDMGGSSRAGGTGTIHPGGTWIVDSPYHPERVIGVADGCGRLRGDVG